MNYRAGIRVVGLGLLALAAASCARIDQAPVSDPEASLTTSALPPGAAGPSNNAGAPVAPKITANVRGPVPTNDWWSSLVFQRFPDNPYSENMHAHPLSMKAKAGGLGVAYPASYVITPDARKYEYTYTEDFTLGVTGLSSPDAKLDGYSDWTVSAYWSGGGSSLKATFGHGLPYVYATKTGGDVQVAFNGAPEVWSNTGNVVGVTIRGHHYGLFAPSGASWRVSGNTLLSSLAGKDYVSVAALPDRNSSTLSEFARHAFAFVTDTKVTYRVDNGNVSTTYTATTTPKEGSETRPLVALYRHQWLNSGAALTGYIYNSARGTMKVLVGNSFSTSLKFGGVLPTLPDSGSYDRNRLAGYLNDAASKPAITGNDTYWVGKSLGRAGVLAHIANQLGNTGARDALLNNMKSKLQDWLTPGGENFFAYEDRWGTLIGYPASYGSDTELNDHHFHYGYFVQAAAAIAVYDPGWASTWKGQINDLIYDAANPGSDTRFPKLRNFDPYAGHSWASGHAAFAAGNNNESSSEAINFATGLVLWGAATGDATVRDLGVYLYATEVSAIEQYWFDVDNAVYPSNFRHPAVGMNWGDGGSYSTWFTAEPEMIQGINLLPIQPGSTYLGSRPDYIKTNWNNMVSENGGEPAVWQDIWWSYLALTDPAAAIAKFDANAGYTPEEGQSKAFTYHWIHNLNALGRPLTNVTASSPTAAVFDKSGKRTYVAYNFGSAATTVTFSDGGRLDVPARSLATSSGGGTNPPPPPPATGTACFFENDNYSGASFCADADSSWVGNAWNDRISSVKVKSGYQVQLFNDINYGGAVKTVTGDTASLPDFNDRTSSFKIVSTTINPMPPPNTGGYSRVGYFVQWGIYQRNFRLADMDRSGAAATLTHLNYAFGGITPEGTCTVTAPGISDSFADYGKSFTAAESVDGVGDIWSQTLRGNFNQIKELKAKHPGLKALISLGGWTWSKNFSDVALTDASRKKFVTSCIDIYIKGNLPSADGAGGPGSGTGVFDGIDIDWEYPASEGNTGNIIRPEDTRNFTLLLEEFRRQLDATGSGKLLTAALPAAPSKIAKLEVANISRVLDLMNVMTYDFRGGWSTTGPTNFHSNLYPDPASTGSGEEKSFSVDTAINAYLQGGAPAKKLIVGVPYYGRGWRGVGSANSGLYQPATGLPQGAYEAGIDDYKVLVNRPGTVYRNAVTKQMWKYDGNEFWSYDDPEVLTTKMNYIRARGLGGSMAWSMEGEDPNASLSKTIFNALK
ncbi:MAG: GH81 / GH18 [uncultured Truepera sp.]|uniref:glucan endo-1,3-beta-D-glucosidase n=1 Tax=uncultured Truepera sp. TaxID=543023 RepID=A0A6J4UQA6_9DEIN|nr:MAG: GH81 / GH18 [uncultured Truepera sp.]